MRKRRSLISCVHRCVCPNCGGSLYKGGIKEYLLMLLFQPPDLFATGNLFFFNPYICIDCGTKIRG